MADLIYNGLKNFKASNVIPPQRIIAYREGIGGKRNNPLVQLEVDAFKSAILRIAKEDTKNQGKSDEELLKTVQKYFFILVRPRLSSRE